MDDPEFPENLKKTSIQHFLRKSQGQSGPQICQLFVSILFVPVSSLLMPFGYRLLDVSLDR